MKKPTLLHPLVLFLFLGICSCTSNDANIEGITTNQASTSQSFPQKVHQLSSSIMSFSSIEEADDELWHMAKLPEEELLQFRSSANIYLQSIAAYTELTMLQEEVNEETFFEIVENYRSEGLLRIRENQYGVFANPLSTFDYRCLLDENNNFIVDHAVYHLLNCGVYAICPINMYENMMRLIDTYGERQFIERLEKGELYDYEDESYNPNDIYDLEHIYMPGSSMKEDQYKKYEKTVENYRTTVEIYVDSHYSNMYNRQDIKIKYDITTRHLFGGIWWLKRLDTQVDMHIYAEFLTSGYDILPIEFVQNYEIKRAHIKNYKTDSYPDHKWTFIRSGIQDVHFSINNKELTITENDIVL